MHEQIIGISPAMISSCGMNTCLETFPSRIFDVGISEQHALTFAAGAAKQGLLPVVNIYSTFLQRAYDQLIHDIALQNLPVLLCIDRAGLVGEDGPTHHGAFDISFLLPIPNIRIFTPNSAEELETAFNWYVQHQTPCAIRYPRGNVAQKVQPKNLISHSNLNSHDGHETTPNASIAILTCGNATNWAINAFSDQHQVDLIHFNQVKPLEKLDILKQYSKILTIEDGVVIGGFGHYIKSQFDIQHPGFTGTQQWLHKGLPDQFVTHGSLFELLEMLQLDNKSLNLLLVNR
jgi:1-deoxy-D-xylulose-5-phosphate synthase